MKIKHLFTSYFGIISIISVTIFTLCDSCNLQQNKINTKSIADHDVKRIGMVIKLDSARLKEYSALHADTNPGVRLLLEKYNLSNFSIFITKLEDGNYYEFGYYEYKGNNYEADMSALDAEPENKKWLKICDPMQIPLKGEVSWKKMNSIYYNK